jgi:hypothetical protein
MLKRIGAIFCTGIFLAACNTVISLDDYKEPGPVDAVLREAPFSRGVNFSGWFEAT